MTESDARKTCPNCGAELPADGVSGLCAKCLLQLGFESEPHIGESTSPYQPTFVAPPPRQLEPYFPELEILELIGHGGMGVVYRARQKDLDRLVALKILRPDIDKDPSFAERFQREARTLAQLDHPNIVTVHNFGRKDDLYFLVMEYVDGTNLRQLERTARLQPAEALAIVPRICEALQYAHQKGVVHRDIKPENILLTQDGRVKIADFGLAKLSGLADQFQLTGTWQIMGTPHYMAPEQFEHPADVDHRADIFSLGVVIYEMLTGELPLGRFPLPSEKSATDRRLDDVIQRALDKEPEKRYQQASDVQSDVESISSSPPSEADRQASRQESYGKVLLEMLTGRRRWGDMSTSLEERAREGEAETQSITDDLGRLDKSPRFLFLGAKVALAAALVFAVFPWPPVVRLSFLVGIVYIPILFSLGHLIRSRQKLPLARRLTILASIPFSPVVFSNLIFLFLKGRTGLLWRDGIENEFSDVPWNDTAAARELRNWRKRVWTGLSDWCAWGWKTFRRQLRFLLALIIGLTLWSVLWIGTINLVDEFVFDRRWPVTYQMPDRVAAGQAAISREELDTLTRNVRIDHDYEEFALGTEICLWVLGSLLLTGLIGYSWFTLERNISDEKRQQLLARLRVLCSRGLIGCAVVGLLQFLLTDWLAFRSGIFLERTELNTAVYFSVWGVILLCIVTAMLGGILIRTGSGRWRRKIGLWGAVTMSLAYPGNLLAFPISFWSSWFLSTPEVRELFSRPTPGTTSERVAQNSVAVPAGDGKSGTENTQAGFD
jgi:serine/threonine protein kinase